MKDHTVISLKDVWTQYDKGVVLEGIDLQVHEREIVSIVGPNGAGKTTLLQVILGFLHPVRGEVRVLGRPPGEMRSTGRLGYLPQNSETDRRFPLTVFDVVTMPLYAKLGIGKRLKSSDKQRVLDVLERVHMGENADHHFGSLSGGQQQRVLIARALVGRPDILILDEPSTGLDAVAQDTFYDVLTDIRDEEGVTIVMVSHDIGTVSSVVDQIACLNKKIHFHGKPEDCIPSDALQKVFGKDTHFLIHDEHCDTCEKRR